MCLLIKDGFKYFIAEEDIICYKIVAVDGDEIWAYNQPYQYTEQTNRKLKL